jgi:dolichol-phosphate mannosyltransferase
MTTISIVVPVYFNAGSLSALADRLNAVALTHPDHAFEFIFVDDGSGDQSYSVLQDLAKKDSRIRVVKLVRNFGSNMAILAGLTYAKGDCAGFIAADLQDPPEKLTEMIHLWETGAKMILAVRSDRSGDPFLTRIFAGVFNYLFDRFVFHGMSPQGIGFFLIDRQVINVILQCQERNAHLAGLLLWTGYPYQTVTYERTDRQHGKSRWTFQKKLKYFIDAFTAFSYLPIRAASVLGSVLALLGSLYALLLVILKFTNHLPQIEGWTTLIVVLLIVSGTQLIMLGVIGEYLWRNLDATRKRPLFLVDQIIESK